MKTLISTISVMLIFTLFGCLDNHLTQPEATFENSGEKVSSNITSTCLPVRKGELKLCCELKDPLSGNCQLFGSLVYIHTTLSNIGGFARIQVEFNMNSELLTRMMHPTPYTITGCNCDTVSVNEMGVAFIEKNYEINNRPDIRIGVKYKVTLDGVEIIGIRLHQIDKY